MLSVTGFLLLLVLSVPLWIFYCNNFTIVAIFWLPLELFPELLIWIDELTLLKSEYVLFWFSVNKSWSWFIFNDLNGEYELKAALIRPSITFSWWFPSTLVCLIFLDKYLEETMKSEERRKLHKICGIGKGWLITVVKNAGRKEVSIDRDVS